MNFNRSWPEYVDGFGDPIGNMWLGLRKIHDMCGYPNTCMLEVNFVTDSGEANYIAYGSFTTMDHFQYELFDNKIIR